MRTPRVAAALAVATVAGSMITAPAHAEDIRRDDSYVVEKVSLDRSSVAVNGLGTAPVKVTVTTRTLPGATARIGGGDDMLTLAYSGYPDWRQFYAPVKRVSTKGNVSTWQGVVHVTGPSRTVELSAVHNCFLREDAQRCPTNVYPNQLPASVFIRVRATNTPVIRVDRQPPAHLSTRAYRISGRVLTPSGRGYGKRLPVIVGRGQECNRPGAGVAARTDTAGRFSLTVTNRAQPAIGNVPPVMLEQCVRLPSAARDTGDRPVALAAVFVRAPWTTPVPVAAPSRVPRRTGVNIIAGPTLLPKKTTIHLERLDGRTWNAVNSGWVDSTGYGAVWFSSSRPSKATYRVRVHHVNVASRQFVIETTP